MTHKEEIVKVQRPIFTNDPERPWLVYDQAQTRVEEIPEKKIPTRIRKLMRNDARGYFKASWDPDSGWSLIKRAPEQRW